MESNVMNIVFGCSREYAKYANVMLYSLFENNRKHTIHIYVLAQEDLQGYTNSMIELAKSYNNNIDFYLLPPNPKEKEIKEIWPYTINIDRWMALDILPESVERFMMVGIDILALGDLAGLYYRDFQGKYMIMCQDMFVQKHFGDDIGWAKNLRENAKKNGVNDLGHCYGNSEIVVVNRSMRQIFSMEEMVRSIIDNKYQTVDQEWFNFEFSNNIQFIPGEEYNYLADMDKADSQKDICTAKIIHYTFFKPWREDSETYLICLWLEWAVKTPGNQEFAEECSRRIKRIYANKCIQAEKYQMYFRLLNKWMHLSRSGINILNRYKWENIAVYGYGVFGQQLLRDVENSGRKCCCIFDKDSTLQNDNLSKNITIVFSENLDDFADKAREADVIIVTPVFYFDEIKANLLEKTKIEIVSLEELIDGE